MMKTTTRTVSLVSAVALVAALAACGKTEDTSTIGQKVDGAVASTERAATEAKADIKAAASDAVAATKDAGATVASTARDINITAKVNAELAKDSSLSAMRINVDTKDGHVALNGTAPSAEARTRATTLASAVEGVIAVDNKLKVEAKSS